MFTYVYLMRKEGSSRCKIGIARQPEVRRRQVDRGVRGKVYIVYARPVLFARVVEKFLHTRFATLRFNFWQAGRSSGRTEWFHFWFWQRWLTIFWIGTFSLLPVFPLFIWAFIHYYDDLAPVMGWLMSWVDTGQ